MTSIINFSPEKMFAQGDFDTTSVQICTDSLKEVFKQTMMNQEVVFRKQVHELHRLYRVQISLMKDLGYKEIGGYNSWKESGKSSLMPQTNPIRYEPQLKEARFSSISMGFQDKENVLNQLKHSFKSINNESNAMDLKLSLNIGVDSRRKEGSKRSCFGNKTHSCPQVVIDLEESTERTSRREAEQSSSLGCSGLITDYAEKHQSQVSVLSDLTIPSGMKNEIYREIAVSSSLVDDGECSQERQSTNQEFKETQDDIPCNCTFTKTQKKRNSCDARQLDLNTVQLDDLSCYSNEPIMAYLSTSCSSVAVVGRERESLCPTTIWRKEISNCSSETSNMLQQDNYVNLAVMNSSGKNKGLRIQHSSSKLSGTCETEASPVNLKSLCQLPVDLSEYNSSCYSDPKNSRDKFTLELRVCLPNDLNHTCVSTKEMSCETNEVENLAYSCSGLSLDKHGNKCAASCKSSCVVDNVSSSTRTTQSLIESGNSSTAVDQFSGIHVQSQVAKVLPGEQYLGSSGDSEMECINKEKESAAVDDVIQRAAESLIHISLENSSCFRDCTTRSGSNKKENEESKLPQNSSDSFELIALKLTESSSDDYSVSSKPFEVNDADKRDFGIKLRRGRRLKDFQKDILPGLASLSRHEICEDISILEGVLRSKEHRKNRARIGDGGNWGPPWRSRRSRLNYVHRRIF